MATETFIIPHAADKHVPAHIVFKKVIRATEVSHNITYSPQEFDYIELIAQQYADGLDLMFAYYENSPRSTGVAYLGHFNDGTVPSD